MKVLHVIARVNLGGTARWLETLTAEELAAGDEVVVATGHVQIDEVEDPGLHSHLRAKREVGVLQPRLRRLGEAGNRSQPLAHLRSTHPPGRRTRVEGERREPFA